MKIRVIIVIIFFCFTKIGFSQESLQYYIQKAKENSPLLQKSNNNGKLIELDLKKYNSIFNSTKINLNSNVLLSPIISKKDNTYQFELLSSGSNDYIGYDLGATNGGQFQALVSLDQPLFTQKFYSVMENKASIEQKRIGNNIQLTNSELLQIVTHQYILCVQSQKQQESIESVIQIIKEQLQQLKYFVNAGVYKLTDLKLLEIELENNQIEEARQSSAFLNNFNSLKLICGISDTVSQRLKDINLTLNTSQVQQFSIFNTKFKLDSLSILADQKIFNLQYLPQINIFGDAGLNATYLPSPKRFGFSIGISLKWNLLDGDQKQINDEKSMIELKNIRIDQEYFENQNQIRKRNLSEQISYLDKQLELIDKQLIEYNKLIDMYKKEIEAGLVSVLELKTVIKDLKLKQQTKVDILMSKEVLINIYNYWNQ